MFHCHLILTKNVYYRSLLSKQKKSEFNLKNVDILEKLDCQNVKTYYKGKKCIELPDNFQVKNELFLSEHNGKEFIITAIKSNLTRSNMDVPT